MGIKSSTARKPRFQVGDQVTVVGLLLHKGKQGQVLEITEGFDSIYRYHVSFSDGTLVTLFGFELALVEPEEKAA